MVLCEHGYKIILWRTISTSASRASLRGPSNLKFRISRALRLGLRGIAFKKTNLSSPRSSFRVSATSPKRRKLYRPKQKVRTRAEHQKGRIRLSRSIVSLYPKKKSTCFIILTNTKITKFPSSNKPNTTEATLFIKPTLLSPQPLENNKMKSQPWVTIFTSPRIKIDSPKTKDQSQ